MRQITDIIKIEKWSDCERVCVICVLLNHIETF